MFSLFLLNECINLINYFDEENILKPTSMVIRGIFGKFSQVFVMADQVGDRFYMNVEYDLIRDKYAHRSQGDQEGFSENFAWFS